MDGRNWIWNWNNVVDVSPFLLFECTGDSESDSNPNMVSLSDDNTEEVSYEVADAQSCCYDSDDYDRDNQEYAKFPKIKSKKMEENYAGYNPNYRDHAEEEEEDEDDDGAIDQDWNCRKIGSFVDSTTMEPVKKEENDKLFWETCLAS